MTKDMTSGAITPLLIKFTIPLVLGNLFQLTYNAADSIIVGKFVGEEALAAVGTSNPLMTLAILFINGMCLGAGILVSTAFGAGDTRLVERQVSTTAIAGTVFSLAFSALCVILALCQVGVAESCQFVLAVHPHGSLVGRLGQNAAKLLLQVGKALVDLHHTGLLVGGEQGTRAHKLLIDLIEQLQILTFETTALMIVDILHTLEEPLVEGDLVLQIGEQRDDLLLGSLYLGCAIRLGDAEEDVRHTVEQPSAVLIGQDGVGKGGLRLVVDDLGNFLSLLPDTFLDSGKVVLALDLTEVGRSERQCTRS